VKALDIHNVMRCGTGLQLLADRATDEERVRAFIEGLGVTEQQARELLLETRSELPVDRVELDRPPA
jgi:hypothetical protein